MNPNNNTIFLPTNAGVDFFEMLRSYMKFSFVVLCLVLLLLVLLWNWQPWFKIEIKPISATPHSSTSMDANDFSLVLRGDSEDSRLKIDI